jgi:hypothetical protein
VIFVGVFIWLFYYAGFTLLFFLSYPCLCNLSKLLHSLYNFNFQLRHCLHQHSLSDGDNDQRMIKKLYMNHFFTISEKALDISFITFLMYVGGGLSFSSFPLAQLFMMQQGYRMLVSFYQQIKQLQLFRIQLRDIDINYPLVEYNDD